MQLYNISDEYINYLRNKFPRVYSNKENSRVHMRKYHRKNYQKVRKFRKNENYEPFCSEIIWK